jgi:hypothetical protein
MKIFIKTGHAHKKRMTLKFSKVNNRLSFKSLAVVHNWRTEPIVCELDATDSKKPNEWQAESEIFDLMAWPSSKATIFFAQRGRKHPLAGEPGSVEFHSAYTRLLAELEAKTLGRRETAYIKGTIGWVIEKYLAADQFTKEKAKYQTELQSRE